MLSRITNVRLINGVCKMSGIDKQQELDATGQLSIRGYSLMQVPLFVDDNTRISGVDPWAELQADMAGSLLIVGKARGLVPDKHFTAIGFRTFGECFLFGRGTEWDIGPQPVNGNKGWETVTRFRVTTTVTKYNMPKWEGNQPGSPPEFPLAIMGINDWDDPNGMSPKPWTVWVWKNKAVLQYCLKDGTRGQVEHDIDESSDTISIDLDTGTLPQPLRSNTKCIFGFGRLCPAPNSAANTGCPREDWPDLEISNTKIYVNGDNSNIFLFQLTGRMQTYDGGKSLPLAIMWSANGTRYLVGMSKTEVSSNGPVKPVMNVDISGFRVTGGYLHAPIEINGVFGSRGLNIRDMIINSGSRGIQTYGSFVCYPIVISDCNIQHQGDTSIWFWSACGVTLERCRMDYPLRAMAEWYWSNVSVTGETMHAPPGKPQQAAFIQYGGTCTYKRQLCDYEYDPKPPFLIFYPYGEGLPAFARIEDCSTGGPAAKIMLRIPGGNVPFAGVCVSGLSDTERTIVMPDGTHQTLQLSFNGATVQI